MVEPRTYLIRRHGAFFRPNAAGYTHEITAAGLYTKTEAEAYLDAEGVTIHEPREYQREIFERLAAALQMATALAETARWSLDAGAALSEGEG